MDGSEGEFKTCRKCGQTVAIDEFRKKPNMCRSCYNAKAREYRRNYLSDPKRRAANKEYQARYHKEACQRSPEYREKRRAQALAYSRSRPPDPFLVKKYREKYRDREYGLVPGQYDEMLALQGGKCLVCRRPPSKKKSLAVDHDHDTGRVRGLLCGQCNQTLGLVRESPRVLRALAKYIEDSRAKDPGHPNILPLPLFDEQKRA
jgi:Recombination endonuclease VII